MHPEATALLPPPRLPHNKKGRSINQPIMTKSVGRFAYSDSHRRGALCSSRVTHEEVATSDSKSKTVEAIV